MGNSPSQHDRDHPSKLSDSTMLFLKQFSVLSEFSNDRSNADRIISNKATNALKYVNSNFRHTLNGHHKKRKRELPSLVSSTPKRRSRRVIDTPSPQRSAHATPSHPSKFDHNYDNHPNIVQSSISYCI